MNKFPWVVRGLGSQLAHDSQRVDVGEWQAMDISDQPLLVTHEITHVSFDCLIPASISAAQSIVEPNMPWAEEHFLERVGGEPLNPPPSHVRWPYAQQSNEEHTDGGQFSHTYPERFWPKKAGFVQTYQDAQGAEYSLEHRGLRYMYGDLADVVEQLKRNPLTRQAYLPVFFPEDTGAVAGQRVPCTLGYHFLVRNGMLDVDYHIRSCDFLRHFRDDVYMAMRLGQWMANQLVSRPDMGQLIMHIGSLHVFEGDMPKMKRMYT